jgi:vesicle transport protein SEC22
LTLCPKSYPQRLAYAYLSALKDAFTAEYSRDEVSTVARPYAFIKFDTTVLRKKREFANPEAASSLDRFNQELEDVHRVMVRNIQDVLDRGSRLDQVTSMSSQLVSESAEYASNAKKLDLEALWRQYGPVAVVVLIVLLLLFIRKTLF